VRPNKVDMLSDFGPEQLNLKRCNVRVMTRGGLTTLVSKERREFYMLTNMDPPPEGFFLTTATALGNLTLWNGTTDTWFMSTTLIVCLISIR